MGSVISIGCSCKQINKNDRSFYKVFRNIIKRRRRNLHLKIMGRSPKSHSQRNSNSNQKNKRRRNSSSSGSDDDNKNQRFQRRHQETNKPRSGKKTNLI